eukprot:6020110-Amphidinium_carterae.1
MTKARDLTLAKSLQQHARNGAAKTRKTVWIIPTVLRVSLLFLGEQGLSFQAGVPDSLRRSSIEASASSEIATTQANDLTVKVATAP